MKRCSLVLFVFLGFAWAVPAQNPAKDTRPAKTPAVDLSEFRTVETAITTRISKASPRSNGQPAYLGVHLDAKNDGRLVIAHVQADSPAAHGGLKTGDPITHLGGQPTRKRD